MTMAASSPATSSRRSPASSVASLKRSADSHVHSMTISVSTLVDHLLVAKRSLSSMNLVLRANELATAARSAHEDSVILTPQNRFLRASIIDQVAILMRLQRGLHATYEWGQKDFRKLVQAMDKVDGKLGTTIEMLRSTEVRQDLRPSDGDRQNLLDFVDETGIDAMREAMKKSIEEFQDIQQTFNGDLVRFETDIRNLRKVMSELPLDVADGDGSASTQPVVELLHSMDEHSSTMAQLLTSLTKHFDMCVTAIRTTEGAAALVRLKAAEVTQLQGSDGLSLSGVIAEQESHMTSLEPKTTEDRAEMLKVVVQDAHEVDDVVREIQERLADMERAYGVVDDRRHDTAGACTCTAVAFAALSDMSDRLADHLAAEENFRARWELERESVYGRLRDMRDMRDFYEGYAHAYGSLVLEVERRRDVNRQVDACWRKARESVHRLLETDDVSRDAFCHDVGDFLPVDLLAGVQAHARRWRVMPVLDGDADGAESLAASGTQKDGGGRA